MSVSEASSSSGRRQRMSFREIANHYKNTPLQIKAKISYATPRMHASSSIEESPLCLDGELHHVEMQDIEATSKLVTVQLHSDARSLVERRRIGDQNFLLPESTIGSLNFNKKMSGTLRSLIYDKKNSLYNFGWLGNQMLDDILRQITCAISRLHSAKVTMGSLSLDSIYYTGKENRPIIKLDCQIKNYEVCGMFLEQQMKKDWKDFGNLIRSIFDLLQEEEDNILYEPYEFVRLREYLHTDNIDLTSVKETILNHPALSGNQRVIFLCQFVEKMNSRKDKKLHLAIVKRKNEILPENSGSDWKKLFDKGKVDAMEDHRLQYEVRKFMQSNDLDPTSEMDKSDARMFVEYEGKHRYNGADVVDYLRFCRNYISHGKTIEATSSIYAIEDIFRQKQPRMYMTLFEIATEHNLFGLSAAT